MLVEILDPVKVDGRVVCDSFRLAVYPETSQLRCKIAFPETVTSDAKLVDLVVFNYTTPRLDGLGASASFRGKEMVTGTEFEAKIVFEALRKKCKFKGHIGPRHFSFDCASVVDVIEKVGQLAQQPEAKSTSTSAGPTISIIPKNTK